MECPHLHLIDRATAKAHGLEKYFPGRKCKRGGLGERRVIEKRCLCAACLDLKKDRKLSWWNSSRERVRDYALHYQKNNPHVFRPANAKRRALERGRLPAWFGEFDEFVMTEAANLALLRAEATGTRWHVDHLIPLRARKASGLHCAHNLQVIPEFLNLAKGNRLWLTVPGEYIAHLGGCK